jgi:transcriptional regulator PpsR
MDDAGALTVNHFDAPEQLFADIDARSAASLIAAAADVALVIDGQGVIRDVSIGSDDLVYDGSDAWVGRHWLETVTVESRPKVLAMLRDAAARSQTEPRWRQVNHPSSAGADVPVLYSAIQVGQQGPVVAVGRDLRTVAALQQRLVDAQQAMERDYLRLRQTEARYRLLFETVAEATIVVDAVSQAVVEANPAAARLIGETAKRIVGRAFLDCLDAGNRSAVANMLAGVRAAGRADDVAAKVAASGAEVLLSASLFREDGGSLLLVRLLSAATEPAARGSAGGESALLRVIDRVPDGFVVTDLQGRVLTANATFVELLQLPAGEQLQGQPLERWLGRSTVDLNVLMGTLRQHGVVRLFPTTLKGPYGTPLQVEISAVAVPQGDPPCMGFTIRDVGRRLAAEHRGRELPRSAGQLAELVGRLPLKDIVGETTDLIERLCIEAALHLTRDNRASAAEMLGLSRQSLYVKLRRYGMGDLGSENS